MSHKDTSARAAIDLPIIEQVIERWLSAHCECGPEAGYLCNECPLYLLDDAAVEKLAYAFLDTLYKRW